MKMKRLEGKREREVLETHDFDFWSQMNRTLNFEANHEVDGSDIG